ncbi:MAG: DMT family transporter [Sciscionella sp.]
MPASMLMVAVPAAVVGAAAMGLANAAQSRATKQVPASGILDPHLILHLLRNPTWLVGTLGTLVGLGLQVVALGFGPLLLVQPMLVTSLLFTSVFMAWFLHRRPDQVLVLGGLMCVAGLAAFLVLAEPGGGTDHLANIGVVLPLLITFAVVVLLCLAVAVRTGHVARVLALALATGVIYGVTAGLMKVVSGEFRAGFSVPFTHWALYVVCAIGPIGFLLSQNTFQQGKLVSPAVAVITTVDPLVGIGIGVSWFDEKVQTGAAALTGELIAAVVIIVGIAILSHRSEHLKQEAAADPEPKRPRRSDPGGFVYTPGA